MPNSDSAPLIPGTTPDDNWLLVQLNTFQLLLPRAQVVTLGPLGISSDNPAKQSGSFVHDNKRYPAFAFDASLHLQPAGETTCRSAILLRSEEHTFALACEGVQRLEILPTHHYSVPTCMRGRRQPFEKFVLIDGKPAPFSSTEALADLLQQLGATLNAGDVPGFRQETA